MTCYVSLPLSYHALYRIFSSDGTDALRKRGPYLLDKGRLRRNLGSPPPPLLQAGAMSVGASTIYGYLDAM
jgi:hypothetical protein